MSLVTPELRAARAMGQECLLLLPRVNAMHKASDSAIGIMYGLNLSAESSRSLCQRSVHGGREIQVSFSLGIAGFSLSLTVANRSFHVP